MQRARESKQGDIVKLYNDRGIVLCIATLTETDEAGGDPLL